MKKTKSIYVSAKTLILGYAIFAALLFFMFYQWNKQLGLEAV